MLIRSVLEQKGGRLITHRPRSDGQGGARGVRRAQHWLAPGRG